MPIAWSLSTAKTDESHVLTAALEDDPGLLAARPGQLIIADKGYVSAELDRWLPTAELGCYGRPTATGRQTPASTCSNPSAS
jgi:hypothetical protein